MGLTQNMYVFICIHIYIYTYKYISTYTLVHIVTHIHTYLQISYLRISKTYGFLPIFPGPLDAPCEFTMRRLWMLVHTYGGVYKWGYPKMDCLSWKILLKWMIIVIVYLFFECTFAYRIIWSVLVSTATFKHETLWTYTGYTCVFLIRGQYHFEPKNDRHEAEVTSTGLGESYNP